MRTRVLGGCAIGLLTALLVAAPPAFAQFFVGRIDVTVEDATGARLPGVLVEVTGPVNQSAVTDATGEAHFLSLSVGTYQVRATLSGFREYRNTNVLVASGASAALAVRLAIAGTEETVDVTAIAPIVDPKRQSTTTNLSLQELQSLPSGRDPWVMVQTVPSVMVDRVNVGGSESGQQSTFVAKGAQFSENTWTLDGLPFTNMLCCPGATPAYYDFDMFEEMSFTTGGADVQNQTSGVGINLVMKRGTNQVRGSARLFFANESMQANNLSQDLAAAIGGQTGKGNRTAQYKDYGVELGGPLLANKLWAWGSAGITEPRVLTLANLIDQTKVKNQAFKLDSQVEDSLRLGFAFFNGDKERFGRGAGPTRMQEATTNQDGGPKIFKGEGNFIIKNNLFMTVRAARVHGLYTYEPQGGRDKSVYQDDGGVWHNSYYYIRQDQYENIAMTDVSYFKDRHELKFGYAYRNFTGDSITGWPGTQIRTTWQGYPNMFAEIVRDDVQKVEGSVHNLYFGDTITLNRLTINLGIRYDRSAAGISPASVPGAPGFESILPSLTVEGIPDVYVFSDVAPRLGLTYALTESRKTQIRATYARFAGQLAAGEASVLSPTGASSAFYLAVDRNGNGTAEIGEIDFAAGLQGYSGFDPANPTSTRGSVNRVGDVDAPLTDELVGGIDHELIANVGISASVTYRYIHKLRWNPRIGVRRDHYTQTGTLSGSLPEVGTYNVPYYALDPSLVPPGGGREYINREGYHQRFLGLEVSVVKRMANRWMARFGFSTNDHREYFDDPSKSIGDPTPTSSAPLVHGGQVLTGNLIAPRYQFVVTGMYQGPWGVNFSLNMLTRQGYAEPYYMGRVRTGDVLQPTKNVLLVNDVGAHRLPTMTSLDARVEKALRLGRTNVLVDLDLFNITNAATVLSRQYDASRIGPTGFLKTLSVMNPRIARVGIRVTF